MVQRLGAVAVDAQDRCATSLFLHEIFGSTNSLSNPSPREDVKIHKARTV